MLDLETLTLASGSHKTRNAELCVMEAVVYFAVVGVAAWWGWSYVLAH